MEIKKVLNLTADEFEKLKVAGKLIREINNAKQTGEIDLLSDDVNNILHALDDVILSVLETSNAK